MKPYAKKLCIRISCRYTLQRPKPKSQVIKDVKECKLFELGIWLKRSSKGGYEGKFVES